MTMYHREGYQEGFLVLRGECLLMVEGQEVSLTAVGLLPLPGRRGARDLGAGAETSWCSRSGTASGQTSSSTRDRTALKHGAGIQHDTPHPNEAYAHFTRPAPDVPFHDEFLTG